MLWNKAPQPPGWFEDESGRFDQRYIDERKRATGYVAVYFWDPFYGRSKSAKFWMSGITGMLSLDGDTVMIVTKRDEDRRGSSRLALPRDACYLWLEQTEDQVTVGVRFELGTGESPTDTVGVVRLRFWPHQADELLDLINELQPGEPRKRPFLRMDEPVAPAPAPVEVLEPAPPVAEVPPRPEPEARPAPPAGLPRLAVRTVPESSDWICFRPGPSLAVVTEPLGEVVRR